MDAADRLESVYPADDAVLHKRASDGTWCFRALFGERTVIVVTVGADYLRGLVSFLGRRFR